MTHNTKFKIYGYSTLILAAFCTVLYTLSFLMAFDRDIGYFSGASILPTLSRAMLGVTLVWILSSLLLIPRSPKTTDPLPYRLTTRIAAGILAAAFAAYAVYRFLFDGDTIIVSPLLPIAAIALAGLSVIFFLLIIFIGNRMPQNSASAGFSVIFWAAVALAEIYTNQYIAMNNPIKVSFMTSMMSIMLFMLYELRFILGRAQPRAFLVTNLTGILLTALYSVSVLTLTATGFNTSAYLPAAILSLIMCVYMISRLFDFLSQYSNLTVTDVQALLNSDESSDKSGESINNEDNDAIKVENNNSNI